MPIILFTIIAPFAFRLLNELDTLTQVIGYIYCEHQPIDFKRQLIKIISLSLLAK